MKPYGLCSCALLLALLLAGGAWAADAKLFAKEAGGGAPIDVKADQTEYRGKENLVIFTGSVTATRGPVTINADKLNVTLDPATREMSEAKAEGNVAVRREDVLATGGKAVYLVKEDTITLTGSPKIWRGSDAVEGETVIMHLTEERMEVKGGSRVILNPQRPKENGAK